MFWSLFDWAAYLDAAYIYIHMCNSHKHEMLVICLYIYLSHHMIKHAAIDVRVCKIYLLKGALCFYGWTLKIVVLLALSILVAPMVVIAHWNPRDIMKPTFSSLTAAEVVVMTISSANRGKKLALWQLSGCIGVIDIVSDVCGCVCQKHVSRARTSNYITQIMGM